MANVRPGYKRIMGEIPVELHEKISIYNNMSDRPLNVSKAIELCMQQAVKKIDDELILSAKAEGGSGMLDDEIYEKIKNDIRGFELSDLAMYEHFKTLVKQVPFEDGWMKTLVYPIDKVEIDESGKIIFSAKGVTCITLVNHINADNFFEKYIRSI